MVGCTVDTLSRIADRVYSFLHPFDKEAETGPLSDEEVAQALSTLADEVQTLKNELGSHADRDHHETKPW
jgi:hypothetical protein